MDNMTPADVMAMTRDNDGLFGGNGFFAIVVLFFIFAMFGGGNLFGGNAAAQGALTRAEMADGFNTAEIQRNQGDLMRGEFDIQKEILENRYANQIASGVTDREILESRFTTQLGFQAAQAQQAQCCCDLKTAIHAEGEATRALINQQTIDDLKYQLNQANTAVANAVQTQNILNSLGRYVTNPSVNPYTCYNGGCGCGV